MELERGESHNDRILCSASSFFSFILCSSCSGSSASIVEWTAILTAVLVWFWCGSGLVLHWTGTGWLWSSFGAASNTIRESGPLAACT